MSNRLIYTGKWLLVLVAIVGFIPVLAMAATGTGKTAPRDYVMRGGKRIWYPHCPIESEELTIEGFDLAKERFTKIEQYVILTSSVLIVSGKRSPASFCLGIADPEKEVFSPIVERPLVGNFPDSDFDFRVFAMDELTEPLVFVLLTYHVNQSGMRVELVSRVIEIYVLDSTGASKLASRETFEETNIAVNPDLGDDFPYRFYKFGKNSEDASKRLPAEKTSSRFLLTDANEDGFTDVIVWKSVFSSRKKNDPSTSDFQFEKEELEVMVFNPKTMTFSPLTPFGSLGE